MRYLTGGYFKPLHAMPVDKIDRRLVADCVLQIERERGQAAAVRGRSVLASMFAWGMVTGFAEHNPLVGAYTPDASPSRDRVLSDAELAAIWKACGGDDFGRIVRLLILTGCRRGEVGGMAWPELDEQAGTWTIPASRCKNGRAHTLPLPGVAWRIINDVPRRTNRDLLFGDRAASGFSAWHISKRALDARLGDAVASWTVHDIRRSTATHMADIGIAPHVIEAVLNHFSGHRAGIVQVYNRSTYEREMRAALAIWADHLHTLTSDGERNVLTFPKR